MSNSSESASGPTTPLWVTVLGFALPSVIGFGSYLTAKDDAETAQRAERATQGQLDVSKQTLAETKRDMNVKIVGLQQELRKAIDPTASRIGATRVLFSTAANADEKAIVLQDFARMLRTESKRQDPLLPYNQGLPMGTDESASFLTALLNKFPAGKVDLSLVDLHGHSWQRAHLAGILLKGADLRGVVLANATLERIALQGGILACADLEGVTTKQVHVDNADLSFANLKGADLSGLMGLKNSQLTGVDYDVKTTTFPDTVDTSTLQAPYRYTGTTTCGNRLHRLPEKSPESSPSASATAPSPSVTSPAPSLSEPAPSEAPPAAP